MSSPNYSANKPIRPSRLNAVRSVVESSAKSPPKGARCRVDAEGFILSATSFVARLAASIFFPQFKTLGCDVDQAQTPAVLKKVSIAASRDRSYDTARRNLSDLAELSVPAKQCQRVAIRIGTERIDEQAERIEEYQKASLPEQQHGKPADAPQNDWSGRVAVIEGDGGRVQIRDELWGKEKSGEKKHRWWRETQCGVLQTYLSKPSVEDPHPEVPDALTDPLWAIPKFNEIHRQQSSSEQSDEAAPEITEPGSTRTIDEPDGQESIAAKVASKSEHSRWSGGDPLVKTVIATRRGYDHLGLALATEAYHRGFNQATSKAFLGDGLKVNWSLWSRHFSHYTPITDLMHALSYVYSAAVACGATIEDGWLLYLQWLTWVWSGEVDQVIEAMKVLAAGRQPALEPLDRAITYLKNNTSRMKYNRYRCAGLPITTSLVESTQKQVNRRVKGTEKFWRDEHLEPLLQLVADDLSDTHDRDDFWERRRKTFNGFRKRRAKT